MNTNTTILFILAATLLTACASRIIPTKSEAQKADYGTEPTFDQAQKIVKKYMESRLLDPESATYKCLPPAKGWASATKLEHAELGGKVHYGYIIPCTINAKNRFGGYVGAKNYGFMIQTFSGKTSIFEISHEFSINIVEPPSLK